MNRPIDPRDIRAIEREQADREGLEKLAREQEVADIKWLMEHAQGRRIMTRLLEITGTRKSSFTGNSTTFFNEGARSVGVLLTDEIIAITPENYLAMLKEQRK